MPVSHARNGWGFGFASDLQHWLRAALVFMGGSGKEGFGLAACAISE